MKAASEIDDEDDDDGFDEADYIATLNQLKARTLHSNDQIVSCTVTRGAAAEDVHGKKHPTYDVTLLGRQGTSRTRSYRFNVLRAFKKRVVNEVGRLQAPFPENKLNSKFLGLSDAELDQRAAGLALWINEFLSKTAPSPLLLQAAVHLFQVDEGQLFGCQVAVGSAPPARARGVSPVRGNGGHGHANTSTAGGSSSSSEGKVDRPADSLQSDGAPSLASSTSAGGDPPLKMGYLSKEGHVVRSIKKRFFVLYPTKGKMYYFEHEQAYMRWSAAGGADENGDEPDDLSSSLSLSPRLSRRQPSEAIMRSSRVGGFGFGIRESISGSEKPKGCIDLLGATLAPFDVTQPRLLKIRTSDGTAFLLRAPTTQEQEVWADAANESALACGRAATLRAKELEQRQRATGSASVPRGGGSGASDGRDPRGQSLSPLAKQDSFSSLETSSGAAAAGVDAEVRRVLDAAGLSASKYAQPLLSLGVRSSEDLADQSVCSESMLRQEVGMTRHEAAAFQKAIAAALSLPSSPSPSSAATSAPPPAVDAASAEDDFMAALEAQATAQAAPPRAAPSPATSVKSRSQAERPFVAKARNVLKNNPKNLTAWALVKDIDGSASGSKSKKKAGGFVVSLADTSPEDFARLYACLRSGLLRPESTIGCFATAASDYVEFAPIFDRIVRSYHRRPEGAHPMNPDNWFVSLSSHSSKTKKEVKSSEAEKTESSPTASANDENDKGAEMKMQFGCALDLRSVDLKQPVRAVLVARRNVAHLPLPAGCHSPAERLAIELKCAGALAWLASQPSDHGESRNFFAGGRTISLTPKQAWAEHAAAAAPIVITSAAAACAAAVAAAAAAATDSKSRNTAASAASFTASSSMALPSSMEAAFAAANSGLAPPGVASMGYLAFGTTLRGSAAARHAGFCGSASSSSSSSAALVGTEPSTDPFVTNHAREAAGLCRDWPLGRGCFFSADRGASLCVRYGFEDHLEVAVVYEGYDVAAPFQRMHQVLAALEGALNGSANDSSATSHELASQGFAVHPQFGFLASCPSHVGTGLSAQLIGVPVPNLRKLYTDQHITDMTSSFGLVVGPSQATGSIGISQNNSTGGSSGSSAVDAPGDGDAPPFGSSGRSKSSRMGEEALVEDSSNSRNSGSSGATTTTVGSSGWVDLAPSRTAFCREADLALKLYHGVRLLLLEDARASDASAAKLAHDEATEEATEEAGGEVEAGKAKEEEVVEEEKARNSAADNGDASSSAVLESAAAQSSGADIAHLPEAERKAVLATFREMLENGVRVVKFNRKGKVAFRTLVLFGDHTLTWRADRQRGGMRVGKGYGSSGAELFDLREMTHVQLGEAPDVSSAALLESASMSASSGAATAAAARAEDGASPPSSSSSSSSEEVRSSAVETSLIGTATLRMHAAGKDGATVAAMRDRGECASLCFDARTIDFGCDCSAQRDSLVQGFRLLLESYTARSRQLYLERALRGRS